MRRALLALSALFAGLLLCAQSVLPGFPPGLFTGRGAIDGAAPTGHAMVTPVLAANGSTTGPSNSATNFATFTQASSVNSYSASIRNTSIAIPGTISTLSVRFPAGIGTGSYAITLEQNGSDTLLTCTISSGTTCTDSHTITIAAGDVLSWKIVPASTPTAATAVQIGAVITSTNNGESFIISPLGGAAVSTSATNFQGFSSTGPNATEVNVSSLVSTGGTISNLYANTTVAPGAAKSYAFTVVQNGTPSGLTCTISGASATTCNDTNGAHAITVAAADTLSIQIVPSGTPSPAQASASTRWVPTIPGEALLFQNGPTALSTTATQFLNAQGNGAGSTEANFTSIAPNIFTVKKLFVSQSTAPGGVTTRTITLRANAASVGTPANVACTVTSALTTCSDIINSYATSINDLLDLQSTVVGTDAAMTWFKAGAVAYIP